MTHESDPHRHATLNIEGMHCASCELMVERKLKAVPGVLSVSADHTTGCATIEADRNRLPKEEDLAVAIQKAGYALSENAVMSGTQRKWLEIGGSFLAIFAIYQLLKAFDLVSLAPSTSDALTLGGVLIIGLVAGTSSCLAVTGGLLLALAAKHTEVHGLETPAQKFKPLLHFNIGRLASYFILGGLVGLLGQSLSLTPKMTGYANIVVALVMLYFSLTILRILPKNAHIRMPKKLSRWIANLSESDHPAAPAALGALTFFLPCGFTQSLQLVALGSGSFMTGAAIMFTFALGTLPSLLGLSALSSTLKGPSSRIFLRFSGALVLVLALFNLQSGFALAGIDLTQGFAAQQGAVTAPTPTKGVQEVSMRVTSNGYEPSAITIKAGMPVRWKVDGTNALGCTAILTIPDLNISKSLGRGENIIEFTAPTKKGRLAFMCSMGMVRGTFNVI
jgi:sulfite exporter TauE/SafE/copper chaperone CopZ